MIADSGSISPVIDLLFHLSLTVLFTIATLSILSLRGWFPDVHASFLSHYFLFYVIVIGVSHIDTDIVSIQGYHLLRITYSKVFCVTIITSRLNPISFATTLGVTVVFLSCSY